jgi:homoserine O-acetyltransferase
MVMKKKMSRRECLQGQLQVVVVCLAVIGLLSGSVDAQDLYRKEGNFILHDFRFQNGEVLPELRLHYITLGTPKRDSAGHITNAVLILHGTTSRGASFIDPSFAGQLFAEGQPLDAGRYYLIIPDSIGHGGSTKPSSGLRG